MRYKEQLRRQRERRAEVQSTILQRGNKLVPLSVEEMDLAEKEILKKVQRESSPEEVLNPSLIKKSSTIVKLDAKMIDGLLCVRGQLRHAPIKSDAKYPIILPKRHHVTQPLIPEYHEKCGHSGLDCRRRQAPVGTQKMADLPKDRVTPNLPPFTNVGVDCFGPITIRRGSSTVKRYAVLFTCLSCRAIHIEVAHSLDTDSFVNAMRRFISKRGRPKEIRSDNGSNFVGGEKELREAINHWNHQQIYKFLLHESTKWTFNPPAGSHHGGVWGRFIRTVRKVLAALLKEQTLDDEGLLTLMCKVEAIVNGRPMRKISDDPQDCEALTPNHLLLLRSGPVLPPAALVKEDQYSNRWRQAQYLADVLWHRWVCEYLPSLQQRQKWSAPMRNFAVGEIGLVVHEKSPRGSWPLGHAQEVYPNKSDGHVRRVKVKTMKSTLERPVDKITLLESAKPAADK
ncbi:uncharacterized protein [Montipora capricornis]|uniref:uncharacterized protein n=1 Tax=Montipora capricornis TaxID=246305 RepID=UPI0035F1F322